MIDLIRSLGTILYLKKSYTNMKCNMILAKRQLIFIYKLQQASAYTVRFLPTRQLRRKYSIDLRIFHFFP